MSPKQPWNTHAPTALGLQEARRQIQRGGWETPVGPKFWLPLKDLPSSHCALCSLFQNEVAAVTHLQPGHAAPWGAGTAPSCDSSSQAMLFPGARARQPSSSQAMLLPGVRALHLGQTLPDTLTSRLMRREEAGFPLPPRCFSQKRQSAPRLL